MSTGQTEKAIKSLCWLRGWVEPRVIKEEFDELVQYVQLSGTHIREGLKKNPKSNPIKMIFRDPLVYRPLIMMLLFFFFSEVLSLIQCKPYIIHLLTEVGLETNQDEILVIFICFYTILRNVIFISLKKLINTCNL